MLMEKHWGTFVLCRAFSPAQEMSISRVRPETNSKNYHILSIHLHKNFLILLQSTTSSLCYSVCVCVWGAGSRRLCLSVLCIAERQVADCPLVLADCVLDEACGFLTVSIAGSEVSCDFYAWASDNIACTTSDPVSRGSRVEVLSCVCPTSDMPSLNRHHSEQMREWDYQQVVPHFLHFFKMMGFWEIKTVGDWWWLRMKLT